MNVAMLMFFVDHCSRFEGAFNEISLLKERVGRGEILIPKDI